MLITFRCTKFTGLKLQLSSLFSLKYRLLIVFFLISFISTFLIYSKILNKLSIAQSSTKNYYAVVIDLGSSGSRVFIYFWPIPLIGSRDDQLLDIKQLKDSHGQSYVKKISPGISTYASHADDSVEYLRPLLAYAMARVPRTEHALSPLYVMATAGLRLLNETDRERMLSSLRRRLPSASDFLFSRSHVEMITGHDEGVFAWVALNHALDSFDSSNSEVGVSHKKQHTVGVFDMGGASLQIAYEINDKIEIENSNKSLSIALGCSEHSRLLHTYRVHAQTYLGFGGDTARRRYQQFRQNLYRESFGVKRTVVELEDPCLNKGKVITVYDEIRYIYNGTGNFNLCRKYLQPLLKMNCSNQHCFMDSKYKPPVDYDQMEFYGFSEFFYTSRDVLNISGKYVYDNFHGKAQAHCSVPWPTLLSQHQLGVYPEATIDRLTAQCLKSAWLSTVLHRGLDFPSDVGAKLTIGQGVRGHDVHWTLGALLYRTRFLPNM